MTWSQVNGKEWRDLRSSASKLFMVSSLRKFVSVFHKNAERLFARMESLRERPEYLKKGIDMQDMFMRYTLDSFAEIGTCALPASSHLVLSL